MGGIMRKAMDQMGTQLASQLPPDQRQAILNSPNQGIFGSLLKVISKVASPIANQNVIPTTPTTSATPTPLVFNNPDRAARIEGSLQNASFGGADIRSILEQLLKSNYLAAGGRVGYEMGGDVMNPYGETIKYNPNLGQFVNATDQQPVDQTQLLQWSAQNPEPLKTQNQTDPALLAQLIQTLKS
jgi:hypothetical protein